MSEVNLPKPGESRETTLHFPEGEIRVEWTTPRFKAWRKLQSLRATRDAYFIHMPSRVSEASDQINETALVAAQVRAFGVPAEWLDVEVPDDKPVEAAVLVESCASADLLTAIAERVLEEAGLSSREKKASSAPAASSSTEADPPETGPTIPPPRSVATEGAAPEA